MSDARIRREFQFTKSVRDRKQAEADFLFLDQNTVMRSANADKLTKARTIYVRARMAEQRALNSLIADLEGEI